MLKIAQVAGFLGSGKTTFMIELAKVLVDRGHKIAIIVNDVGEINVDVKIMEMYGLKKAKEISGGCICCQIAGTFANTIAVLQKDFQPDMIIVEPSGVAIPWGLKRAAEYSEEEMDELIVHAPVVVLVDTLRIDDLIKTVHRLVETQIREADVVFINKVDSTTQDKIDLAVKFSKSINPAAEIMYGSGKNNQGVKEVADLIETRTSPRYDETYEKELLRRDYRGKA